MKSSERHVLGFAYAVGEEVAARIENIDVFSLQHASLLPTAFCPDWTIATIMDHIARDGRRCYAIRFLLFGEAPHVALVPEEAIEGTV